MTNFNGHFIGYSRLEKKSILKDIRSGALPLVSVFGFLWFWLTGQESFWERRSNPVYLVDERQ